jgi:hypothetical protein
MQDGLECSLTLVHFFTPQNMSLIHVIFGLNYFPIFVPYFTPFNYARRLVMLSCDLELSAGCPSGRVDPMAAMKCPGISGTVLRMSEQ